MKVVMVNDCSFVGETLLKNLPKEIDSVHLKRSRNFFDKTFKIAWKISRSKGDVYHFNYLLQDCYIGSKLGKRPLVGHAHGTDVRKNLNHFVWKRIVKHNLKKCDVILVSTPDILEAAQNYREDAEYLPNPVDSTLFYPKPVNEQNEKLKVLIASDSNWSVKGTDIAIHALAHVKNEVEISLIRKGVDFTKTVALAESLGLHLNILQPTAHENMNEYFWNADLVIDRFKLGSLGLISLEAIACGRPVLNFVSSDYKQYEDFPIKEIDSVEKIVELLKNLSPKLWESEYDYVKKHHDSKLIGEKMAKIYESLI
ncbi:MAG: glycosyltransferase [Candidatus Bathyarchaeota archaeon]|nr:glycosyltransferase [Candidatus Bathyarchaeum sp.]